MNEQVYQCELNACKELISQACEVFLEVLITKDIQRVTHTTFSSYNVCPIAHSYQPNPDGENYVGGLL